MKAKTWKLNPSQSCPGWLVVVGPYDSEFIDDLKATVPPKWRAFVQESKVWRVHESYAEDVRRVIQDHSVFPPAPEPEGAEAAAGFALLLTRIGPASDPSVVANIREGVLIGVGEVSADATLTSIDVREFVVDGRRALAVAAILDIGGAL